MKSLASIFALACAFSLTTGLSNLRGSAQQTSPGESASPEVRAVLNEYCIICHSQRLRTAGLDLETLAASSPEANPELWERVIAKLRSRTMPPAGMPRPDRATYRDVAGLLETAIDRAWAAHPNPGRINAVHRLNRTEYRHAVRDLFALDVDVSSLLPGDETADGSFDNFADALTI
jgi:mono/diheme cytochrome c family protein